jgi:hypothetical protein
MKSIASCSKSFFITTALLLIATHGKAETVNRLAIFGGHEYEVFLGYASAGDGTPNLCADWETDCIFNPNSMYGSYNGIYSLFNPNSPYSSQISIYGACNQSARPENQPALFQFNGYEWEYVDAIGSSTQTDIGLTFRIPICGW